MSRLNRVAVVIVVAMILAGFLALAPVHSQLPGFGSHAPRQIVLKLAPGRSLSDILTDYNAHLMGQVSNTGIYLIHLDGGWRDLAQILTLMQSDVRIVWAERNFIGRIPEADPYEIGAWGGYDPAPYYAQYAGEAINLPWTQEMWQGSGMLVAIIDTGVQLDHPLLAPRIHPDSWDFVDNDAIPADEGNGQDDDLDGHVDNALGHGTHVAGIVNLVAPQADLLVLRVLNDEGQGYLFDVIRAINYAVDHGAQVINMSMGATDSTHMLEQAVADAASAGVIMVAAAGNLDSMQPQYPAALEQVIGVAALDENRQKADFSNYGDWVDIAAPGVGIYSTYPVSGYGWWSGTSMAAPFVTGQVALVRQAAPALSPAEVIDQVLATAVDVDGQNPAYAGLLGSGQLDTLRSVGCYWADVAPDARQPITGHNCDYQVDLQDIVAVAGVWDQPVDDARDVNGDGSVDIVDVMQIAQRWGWMP